MTPDVTQIDDSALLRRLVPPDSPRAGAALADRLVTAIAVGAFVPGQRLPAERELAESLGLSRGTVRDALAKVTALGLLEVRRGRSGGAFVRSPWSPDSASAVREVLEPRWAALEQVMDLRHLVEALVARTAAERRSAEDITVIETALHDYEDSKDDLAAAQAADLRLHHAVARATHNPRLLDLRERLLEEISLGFAVEPFSPSIYRRALTQHQTLATAVTGGDELAAWTVGREHFAITTDELRATFERAKRD